MKNNGADITFLLCLKSRGLGKKNLGKFLLQRIMEECEFNFFACESCGKKIYWSNLFICQYETICSKCLEPKQKNEVFCYYDISESNYVEIYYGRIIITFLKETFKVCTVLLSKNEIIYIKKRFTLADKFLLQHFDQYEKIVCGCKAVQNYIHSKFLE